MGVVGAVFVFIIGMLYLNWNRQRAEAAGEGYGTNLVNEPEPFTQEKLPNPYLAITPLLLVGILNYVFTLLIPMLYGQSFELTMTGIGAKPVMFEIPKVAAIWAVQAALLSGILFVVVTAWQPIKDKFAEGAKLAVGGSLLASMNTASEYGFGGVIASLPGFLVVADALRSIPNPLINEAITVTTLAGITGSASGGLSIALATMSEHFITTAHAAVCPKAWPISLPRKRSLTC